MLAIPEVTKAYFFDNLNFVMFVIFVLISYQISVEWRKETLLEQQLKGFDLRIRLELGGRFKTFLQLSTLKQTLGGRPCQVSDAMNHLSLALQHRSAGPKVNKFLLDVHFPIWSVTH